MYNAQSSKDGWRCQEAKEDRQFLKGQVFRLRQNEAIFLADFTLLGSEFHRVGAVVWMEGLDR